MQAEPCRRSLACAGDSRARQGKGALVRACAVDRRLSQFHTQQRMACAEFRKFRLDLDTGSNIYERKHIPDPPGYDPNIAREQVSMRVPHLPVPEGNDGLNLASACLPAG